MGWKFGLVLLGLLLAACLVPAFSMTVIFPLTFLFGDAVPFQLQLVTVYILSVAASAWIISRIWTLKPAKFQSNNSSPSK